MKPFYFFMIIASLFSCRSSSKKYGFLSTRIDSAPALDTSKGGVDPTSLGFRSYFITNNSNSYKIKFVCKAHVQQPNKHVKEYSEEHILVPHQTEKLKMDSSLHNKVLKYEIVNAELME